jgi:hypothetical protein
MQPVATATKRHGEMNARKETHGRGDTAMLSLVSTRQSTQARERTEGEAENAGQKIGHKNYTPKCCPEVTTELHYHLLHSLRNVCVDQTIMPCAVVAE